MGALSVSMFVCRVSAWCLKRPEEVPGGPKTRVAGNCELQCGCWTLNLGPLEKQLIEPSLQPGMHISNAPPSLRISVP